jgi:ubiquinone/menaquinone biosynthesis C-methylase UbiE
MSKHLSQEQVWNTIAEKWSEYRDKPIKEVLEFLKDKKGKILDLGCGSGRNLIDQKNLEYYGVDFSDKMLNLFKKKAEKLGIKIKTTKSNAEKLSYDNEFFDYALFISTLHCIENETLRKKSLQELYRVLKKNGEAIISVWDKNSDTKISKLEAKEGFVDWKFNGNNYKRYYYFYDTDELDYLLKEIGFEIVKIASNTSERGEHSWKNILFYVKKY